MKNLVLLYTFVLCVATAVEAGRHGGKWKLKIKGKGIPPHMMNNQIGGFGGQNGGGQQIMYYPVPVPVMVPVGGHGGGGHLGYGGGHLGYAGGHAGYGGHMGYGGGHRGYGGGHVMYGGGHGGYSAHPGYGGYSGYGGHSLYGRRHSGFNGHAGYGGGHRAYGSNQDVVVARGMDHM